MATLSTAVGAQIVTWGINNVGYCQGTNGALTNGSQSGMGRLIGVENINIPLAKSRAIAIPGDNGLIGTQIIAPNTATTGDLSVTVNDPVFSTAPIGMLVDTSNSKDYALLGVPCPNFKSLTIINNSPAQNQTSGSKGVPGWSVSVYPNAMFYPRGNDSAQDGQQLTFMYDMILSTFDKYPWGEATAVVDLGATTAIRMNPFFSLAPWTIHAFVSNASATTITLNETPYAATAAYIEVWKNGTLLTITSDWTISGKVITLGAAGSAGDKYEVWYGFIPTC